MTWTTMAGTILKGRWLRLTKSTPKTKAPGMNSGYQQPLSSLRLWLAIGRSLRPERGPVPDRPPPTPSNSKAPLGGP